VAITSFEEDTVPGHYGIREPRPDLPAEDPARLRSAGTVWLVPGLAFDSQGHRLGRGGGYYDRLLADVSGPRIGVTLERQILTAVPSEAHDAAMTMVVSQDRVLHVPSTPCASQLRKETPCPQISSKPCLSPQPTPMVPDKSS
jgi:5-formyltetrahydrofolate cyclo-ligase